MCSLHKNRRQRKVKESEPSDKVEWTIGGVLVLREPTSTNSEDKGSPRTREDWNSTELTQWRMAVLWWYWKPTTMNLPLMTLQTWQGPFQPSQYLSSQHRPNPWHMLKPPQRLYLRPPVANPARQTNDETLDKRSSLHPLNTNEQNDWLTLSARISRWACNFWRLTFPTDLAMENFSLELTINS